LVIEKLPNVHVLDWRDHASPPRSFFDHLPKSSIQYLKLLKVSLEEEFEINSLAPTGEWRLRSLHLDVRWCRASPAETTRLCSSILQHCAKTLQSLTWEWSGYYSNPQSFDVEKHGVPEFPRLHTLTLDRIRFKNEVLLKGLLDAPLTTLTINTGGDALVEQCLAGKGNIRSLETIVWEGQLPETYSFDFLKENEQISKLRFSQPLPIALIENKLLPLLSSSFTKLKSLSLTWQEETKTIDVYSLLMVSKLKGLEQIHLSAGRQRGKRPNWQIDHDLMRQYLSRLPRLRKIAFSRDSYNDNLGSIDDYYQRRIPDPGLIHALGGEWKGSAQALWEHGHLMRMMAEAKKYMSVMPNLEWIFFGQIPIEVQKRKVLMDYARCVIPIMPLIRRDKHFNWTSMAWMFGTNKM
jgi:hypothetical protein